MTTAMARTAPPDSQAILLLSRGVLIEMLRRRDIYVLLILMALFVTGALASRMVGIGEASTATFLLNLGMTLAYLAAHAMTLLLSARQIPDELENRTLYPLLAKPVSRPVVILGKWAACTACGFASFLVLLVLGWVPVPKMETYAWSTMAQLLLLQLCSFGVLTGLTLALSLLLPKGVNIVLCGMLVAFGAKVIGFLGARAMGTSMEQAAGWFLSYVPDFSKWNLITRYTDGVGPLGAGEFLGLVLHAIILMLLGLGVAVAAFHRRPL